jgi:hypothetical protein
MNLSARISATYSPITHRRVKVDKDGARDEFAIAKLGENCFIRFVLVDVRNGIAIDKAISRQAVLEQITI